jgi:hypothetical protein
VTGFFAFLWISENRSYYDVILLNRGKNIAVHLSHQGAADVKSQAAAAVAACIRAAPEAVENMRKLIFTEGAAAVADMYELTIFLP